jgi:ribosomal protein L14E/L6E/L27E
MEMETVAFDTSSVIHSIEEAAAGNKSLIMTRTDASYLEVEQRAKDTPGSPLEKLFKNVIYHDNVGYDRRIAAAAMQMVQNLTQEMLNQAVFIISDALLTFVGASACVIVKIMDERFFFLRMGEWKRDPVRRKSMRIHETGLDVYYKQLRACEAELYNSVWHHTPNRECVCNSVDKFIAERMTIDLTAMKVKQVSVVLLFELFATL